MAVQLSRLSSPVRTGSASTPATHRQWRHPASTFDDPATHRAVVREAQAIQWTSRRQTRRDSVSQRRSSMWLAAYALGLAHTASSPDTCVRELLSAADGCDVLLHEARQRLATLTNTNRALRDRAGRLLTEAAIKGE